MKNLKRKRTVVIIYLIIACVIMVFTTIGSYFLTVIADRIDEATSQVESFVATYNSAIDKSYLAYKGVSEDLVSRARLYASAAQEDLDELEPKEYGSGYIIKVEGDNLITPDGFPKPKYFSAEIFTEDYEAWGSSDKFIMYARIDGPFYYVEFSKDAVNNVDDDELDVSGALSNLANANGCDYIYVENGELSTECFIFAGTNDYAKYRSLGDTGLSEEQIEKLSSNGDLIAKINGSYKALRLVHPESKNSFADVLMIIDLKDILISSLQQSVMILIVIMIILILLCVWIFSVYDIVRKEVLNEDQRIRYNPKNLQRRMISVLIASGLIVFIFSSFIISLDCLFIESSNGENVLAEYIDRIQDDEIRTENTWQKSQNRYISTARQLAALIDEHRNLQNVAWLRQAAEIIEADYIMIYDTNGDEVISSGRYRGMSLGTDPESATYDFRRLLRGVGSISHAGLKDETTGLTRDMHGIALRYLSNEKSYGALLIAVDPEQHSATIFSDMEGTASAMSPADGFISGVDPETGIIKYSSDAKMQGANMKELCKDLEEYTGTFMGFVKIDGIDYYVRSAEHDGIVYYCGVRQSEMFAQVVPRSYRITYRFLIIAAILAVILFAGYDQKTFNEYAGEAVAPSEADRSKNPNYIIDNTSAASPDLSRKQTAFMKRSYFSFRSAGLSPAERVKDALQFLILISTVLLSLFILLDKSGVTGASGSDDVIEYIAHGDWNRGFNLFSIAAILFLICILVVGLYILKTIAGILYMTMDTKGRTAFMLIINMLHYIAIIIIVFFSLGYLGVNTRALVASAGLAGIAVTFGAKDLIADIIAGVMILVDNTYNVGEIIEVNGFRGEVAEIGMRSTKVIGRGDNVKTIRNSSIGDVINYSRLNSWYPLVLTVSTSQSLDDLEEMLNEELPKISREHSEMIRGPEYRGVDSINGDKTSLLFLTECREEDYDKVQLEVNREIRNLFKSHNIELF